MQNPLGHSFRRTSTTIYANAGASIEALKRHTGHKANAVCESYIDESMEYKKKTARAITSSLNLAKVGTSETQTSGSCLDMTGTHTGSTVASVVIDSNDHPVTPLMVGHGTTQRLTSLVSAVPHRKVAPSTVTSSGIPLKVDPLYRRTIPSDNFIEEPLNTPSALNDVNYDEHEPTSQQISCTQISSQTFIADMQKQFEFYKCDNLTIKFGQFPKKKKFLCSPSQL